jgi:large subunit ribosomal protein L22
MPTATARARMIRMAPRKMRLVADLIRGKSVAEARGILAYTRKASAPLIGKILDSAVANAEHEAAQERQHIDTDDMVIRLIKIDDGPTIRRFISAPRGRAMRVRKRTSHVELVITDE